MHKYAVNERLSNRRWNSADKPSLLSQKGSLAYSDSKKYKSEHILRIFRTLELRGLTTKNAAHSR